MYRALLVLFLLFLGCYNDPPENENLILQYGEEYATIPCVWIEPGSTNPEAIWRCYGDLETQLLSGWLYLELEHKNSLWFCGENLELNSGVSMYDNLIRFLTEDRYDCLHITEDKEKGNTFDWSWNHESQSGILQLIWRPEEDPHKLISIVISNKDYNEVVIATIHYKTLSQN